MEWFKEEWVDSDAKALGTYVAMLYIRFKGLHESVVKDNVRGEISRLLSGEDGYEAWKSAKEFIESFYSYYSDYSLDIKSVVNEHLHSLEKKYYEKFKKACYKYFRQNIIKNYNKEVVLILRNIRKEGSNRTSCGSYSHSSPIRISDIYKLLTGESWNNLDEDERRRREERLDFILIALISSRILWFNEIIPAPFLEDEFLEKLERGEEVFKETNELTAKERREETAISYSYRNKKPSREILEAIVFDVLKKFGFDAKPNMKISTKMGNRIEIDIWGIKTVGNTRFYVYASCKNWDKKVDSNVIYSEIGRINDLKQHPHLKIFVCKELTSDAREIAQTAGFTVIELKKKANSENAGEIAEIIYNHLNDLFTGIAPPELQRIALEAKKIAENSKKIADNLKSLANEIEKLVK